MNPETVRHFLSSVEDGGEFMGMYDSLVEAGVAFEWEPGHLSWRVLKGESFIFRITPRPGQQGPAMFSTVLNAVRMCQLMMKPVEQLGYIPDLTKLD